MDYSEQLKAVMGRVIGGRPLRAVAADAGCDPTLIWRMQKYGHVPLRRTVERIADNLDLSTDLRADLFAAAGYVEFAAAVEVTV